VFGERPVHSPEQDARTADRDVAARQEDTGDRGRQGDGGEDGEDDEEFFHDRPVEGREAAPGSPS
jgi:hypothetical protein